VRIHDITGYRLGDAVRILNSTGIENIKIVVTAPPGKPAPGPGENSRVVRQNISAGREGVIDSVEIVVCD